MSSHYRPPPRHQPPLPPRWTTTERGFDHTPLAKFVLLSMLLHAIAILLFGAPAGGSREGRAIWGALNIELVGPFRDASSRFKPEPTIVRPIPRPVMPKPTLRPGYLPEPTQAPPPVEAPPVAEPPRPVEPALVLPEVTPPLVTPEPPKAAPPEAISIPPLLDRLALPPERKLETPPEFKVPPPTPIIEAPRVETPPPPPVAPAPPPRVERVPAEAPPVAAPLLQPLAPAPPLKPMVEQPRLETPALPTPPPPTPQPIESPAVPSTTTPQIERAPVQAPPVPATPVETAPPARVEPPPARPIEMPKIEEAPAAAPKAPPRIERAPASQPEAAPRREPLPGAQPRDQRGPATDSPFRRAPEKGPSTYDPTAAPKIDPDALRRRASELAREGTGNRALLPFPMPPIPKKKSQLETALENARKPDCRTAYKDLGLAAVVPLIANEFGEGTCRW